MQNCWVVQLLSVPNETGGFWGDDAPIEPTGVHSSGGYNPWIYIWPHFQCDAVIFHSPLPPTNTQPPPVERWSCSYCGPTFRPHPEQCACCGIGIAWRDKVLPQPNQWRKVGMPINTGFCSPESLMFKFHRVSVESFPAFPTGYSII